MRFKDNAKWKFIVENGQLMRECTKCQYHSKKQELFCPNCHAYMRAN